MLWLNSCRRVRLQFSWQPQLKSLCFLMIIVLLFSYYFYIRRFFNQFHHYLYSEWSSILLFGDSVNEPFRILKKSNQSTDCLSEPTSSSYKPIFLRNSCVWILRTFFLLKLVILMNKGSIMELKIMEQN